jgi:hypothetical protein
VGGLGWLAHFVSEAEVLSHSHLLSGVHYWALGWGEEMDTVTVCIAIGVIVGLACIVGYLADGTLMMQSFPKDQP